MRTLTLPSYLASDKLLRKLVALAKDVQINTIPDATTALFIAEAEDELMRRKKRISLK